MLDDDDDDGDDGDDSTESAGLLASKDQISLPPLGEPAPCRLT